MISYVETFLMFCLHRIPVYSGFSLDRVHCKYISRKIKNALLNEILICFKQSYMEDHLKNKDRLDREWEALCSYEADPASTKVAADSANSRKNRYSDILPCKEQCKPTM